MAENTKELSIVIRAKNAAEATLNQLGGQFGELNKLAKAHETQLRQTGFAFVGMAAAGAAAFAAVIKASGDLELKMFEVRKTSGLAADEIGKLSESILDLSTRVPQSAKELGSIAAIAGQLGIQGRDNILAFTETIAKIVTVTDFTVEGAANALARLSNLFGLPIKDVERLGGVINEMENTTTAKAPGIADMMMRMATSAVNLGMKAQDVAGLSATLVDLGFNSELAGTAVSTTFNEMISKAGKFGAQMGLTAKQFRESMHKDAIGTLIRWGEAMKALPMEEMLARFEEVGISASREGNVFMSMVNGLDKLKVNVAAANEEFITGKSLQNEFATSMQAAWKHVSLLQNEIMKLATHLGNELLPAFGAVVDVAAGFIRTLDSLPGPIRDVMLAAGLLTTGLFTLTAGLTLAAAILPSVIGGFAAMSSIVEAYAATVAAGAVEAGALNAAMLGAGPASAAAVTGTAAWGIALGSLMSILGQAALAAGAFFAAWEIGRAFSSEFIDAPLGNLIDRMTGVFKIEIPKIIGESEPHVQSRILGLVNRMNQIVNDSSPKAREEMRSLMDKLNEVVKGADPKIRESVAAMMTGIEAEMRAKSPGIMNSFKIMFLEVAKSQVEMERFLTDRGIGIFGDRGKLEAELVDLQRRIETFATGVDPVVSGVAAKAATAIQKIGDAATAMDPMTRTIIDLINEMNKSFEKNTLEQLRKNDPSAYFEKLTAAAKKSGLDLRGINLEKNAWQKKAEEDRLEILKDADRREFLMTTGGIYKNAVEQEIAAMNERDRAIKAGVDKEAVLKLFNVKMAAIQKEYDESAVREAQRKTAELRGIEDAYHQIGLAGEEAALGHKLTKISLHYEELRQKHKDNAETLLRLDSILQAEQAAAVQAHADEKIKIIEAEQGKIRAVYRRMEIESDASETEKMQRKFLKEFKQFEEDKKLFEKNHLDIEDLTRIHEARVAAIERESGEQRIEAARQIEDALLQSEMVGAANREEAEIAAVMKKFAKLEEMNRKYGLNIPTLDLARDADISKIRDKYIADSDRFAVQSAAATGQERYAHSLSLLLREKEAWEQAGYDKELIQKTFDLRVQDLEFQHLDVMTEGHKQYLLQVINDDKRLLTERVAALNRLQAANTSVMGAIGLGLSQWVLQNQNTMTRITQATMSAMNAMQSSLSSMFFNPATGKLFEFEGGFKGVVARMKSAFLQALADMAAAWAASIFARGVGSLIGGIVGGFSGGGIAGEDGPAFVQAGELIVRKSIAPGVWEFAKESAGGLFGPTEAQRAASEFLPEIEYAPTWLESAQSWFNETFPGFSAPGAGLASFGGGIAAQLVAGQLFPASQASSLGGMAGSLAGSALAASALIGAGPLGIAVGAFLGGLGGAGIGSLFGGERLNADERNVGQIFKQLQDSNQFAAKGLPDAASHFLQDMALARMAVPDAGADSVHDAFKEIADRMINESDVDSGTIVGLKWLADNGVMSRAEIDAKLVKDLAGFKGAFARGGRKGRW